MAKTLTPAQKLRKLKADARVNDFTGWCVRNGLPAPLAEYKFCPTRKWKHDFYWPFIDAAGGVALENQGGIFSGGRHTRGAALLKEHEKLNASVVAGNRILFTTPQTIKSREMLATLRALLT